jgi:hypothetical protein
MADYVNKLKKKQTQKQTNTTPSLCMEINLQIRALTWVSHNVNHSLFIAYSYRTRTNMAARSVDDPMSQYQLLSGKTVHQFANSCINVGFTRITEPYLRF